MHRSLLAPMACATIPGRTPRTLRHMLALILCALLFAALSGCCSDDVVAGGPSQVGGDGVNAGDGSLDGSTADAGKTDTGGGDTSSDAAILDTTPQDTQIADDGETPDTVDPDSGDTDVPLDVVALTLTPAAISLPVGGQVAFVLDAKLADGSSVDASAKAQWS